MIEFNKQYKLPIKIMHGMCFDAKGLHIFDIVCEFPYDKPLSDLLIAKINNVPTDIIATKTVFYNPTGIYTTDGVLLIAIRGWGRFKYHINGEEIQDNIGREIAELINNS